jgi:DNA-binding winged helix-turn-helix (wHTH) protein
MGTNGCNTNVVQFGAFELDPRNCELRRNGVVVYLQPRSFRILQLLVSRPNDLVTRDEVKNILWPAESAGDFDSRLKFHIKKIRDALADHGETPIYIQTVRNSGYRFVAPVQRRSLPLVADSEKLPTAEHPHLSWSRPWVAFGGVLVVLVSLAVFLLGRTLRTTSAAVPYFRVHNFPVIAAVTPILPDAVQTIIIRGHGLGTHAAFANVDSSYLAIRDKSAHWAAGRITPENVDEVTLTVASWTDSELVVSGFSGAYGTHWWRLNRGDEVEIVVWNPQSGAGPATYTLHVSAGT